jgi:hypothetical protein
VYLGRARISQIFERFSVIAARQEYFSDQDLFEQLLKEECRCEKEV